MSMTDTIGDMLTRIRNGQKSKLISVPVPYSKVKSEILKVLEAEGYIKGYKISDDKTGFASIEVELKYSITGKPAICEIKRMSKPGKRMYSPIKTLRGCYNNMGIHIVSTSKGMISDRDAHRLKVGGELICKVF